MKLKILIEKPRRLVYPRHNSHNKWCPRHRKNKVQMLGSFVEREKNTHRMRYRDKSLSRVWGKDHPETAPPRVHPIYSYTTQTLLWMPTSAGWQEPDTAVTWEALLVPDKYREGHSQRVIKVSMVYISKGSSVRLTLLLQFCMWCPWKA